MNKEEKAQRITILVNELAELTAEFGWTTVWIGGEGKNVQVRHLPLEWRERESTLQWSKYQYKYGLIRNGVRIYYTTTEREKDMLKSSSTS